MFKTVIQIEGTFEMTTPVIHLGYSRSSVASPNTSMFINSMLEVRSSTYITVFINLEPNIDIANITTAKLDCTELSDTRVMLWVIK